jgi:hypothetical protein
LDCGQFEEALIAYRKAASLTDKDADPLMWANSQIGVALVLKQAINDGIFAALAAAHSRAAVTVARR